MGTQLPVQWGGACPRGRSLPQGRSLPNPGLSPLSCCALGGGACERCSRIGIDLRGILSQVLKAQPATGHRLRGPLSKQEPELEGLGNSRPLRKAEVSQHVRGGQQRVRGSFVR